MKPDPAGRMMQLAASSFGPHFLVFVVAAVGVAFIAAATDWRWLYWVPLVWSLLLLVHYLFYKARTIDDRWVEERTDELRLKSYDRDHIETIRSNQGRDEVRSGEPSRRPPV
jgi:hypothetical protein